MVEVRRAGVTPARAEAGEISVSEKRTARSGRTRLRRRRVPKKMRMVPK